MKNVDDPVMKLRNMAIDGVFLQPNFLCQSLTTAWQFSAGSEYRSNSLPQLHLTVGKSTSTSARALGKSVAEGAIFIGYWSVLILIQPQVRVFYFRSRSSKTKLLTRPTEGMRFQNSFHRALRLHGSSNHDCTFHTWSSEQNVDMGYKASCHEPNRL